MLTPVLIYNICKKVAAAKYNSSSILRMSGYLQTNTAIILLALQEQVIAQSTRAPHVRALNAQRMSRLIYN